MNRQTKIAELEADAAKCLSKCAAVTQNITPSVNLANVLINGYMKMLKDAILPLLARKGIVPTSSEIVGGQTYVSIVFSISDPNDMEGGDQVVVALDLLRKTLDVIGIFESQGGAEKLLLSMRVAILMTQPLMRIAAMVVNSIKV